jgi:acylphosphatase
MATHLIITGLVQGVGYRYALAERAQAAGLRGWVRNRADGSVEACVAGPVADVAALVIWAERGPPAARVRAVVSRIVDDSDCAGDFAIRPTV